MCVCVCVTSPLQGDLLCVHHSLLIFPLLAFPTPRRLAMPNRWVEGVSIVVHAWMTDDSYAKMARVCALLFTQQETKLFFATHFLNSLLILPLLVLPTPRGLTLLECPQAARAPNHPGPARCCVCCHPRKWPKLHRPAAHSCVSV